MQGNGFSVRGRVVLLEDRTGVFGLTVVVYDKDHLFDDRLGSTITNDEGEFVVPYREWDFRDFVEKKPDLYINVLDHNGHLVYSSENAVLWDADRVTDFSVTIPRAKLDRHLREMHHLARLSGGIVAQDKLDTIDRAVALLDRRGMIGHDTPLGSRPFGHGGPAPIPFNAWYCPAPDIFVFGDILEIAWGVIENDPRAILEYVTILETIIHRQKVRKPEQFAAASARWRTNAAPEPESLGKLLAAKQRALGAGPSETLIEKERYLPLIAASILAAKGDRAVANRYVGVTLGAIGALGQMDAIYRAARNALRSNPGGIGSLRNLLGFVGGTCGPDDGPMPWPVDPEDIFDVDDIWRIEKWFCTAEMDRAMHSGGLSGGSYEIHDVDWSDGCPGSPIVITGENFTGMFPSRNRVLFADRSGWGTVEAAPVDPDVDWTDTRIQVPLPAEAGPGPISLRIIGGFATACGSAVEVYRRGRGATFDFAGGAAYIRHFTADGERGNVRVDAGDTVHLRWVVVPEDASVDLSIDQDGVVTPHSGLDAEAGLDVSIPAGRPSVTVCTLTADNACAEAAAVREIRLNAYVDPALSVAGIEATQAIQRFNITGDLSANNSVRLAQGKRTMVRAYVDSGRRDGFDEGDGPNVQPRVTGQLAVTDLDSGTVDMLSPVNPTGDTMARPAANIVRDDLEHSLNFRIPSHLAVGRKELRTFIESTSPYGEPYTTEDAIEVSFTAMGELKLLRILCTDNITGNVPTVAGWGIGHQGTRTRYPLAHDGFPIYTAPGNTTISTNEDLTTSAGWDNLLDDLDDIADDYEDIGQVWCMTVPDDSTYQWNGLGTSGGHPRFICKESLAASFPHELGHTQGVGHSGCDTCVGCAGSPAAGSYDSRLPTSAQYDETGVDVYAYEALAAGHGDLMSYCDGPGGDRQKRWPSVEFWNILFDRYS